MWWGEDLALKPQSQEEVLSVESKAKGINVDQGPKSVFHMPENGLVVGQK